MKRGEWVWVLSELYPLYEVKFKATATLQIHSAPEKYCWNIFNPTHLLSHHFLTHAVILLTETPHLLWALCFTYSQQCVLADIPTFYQSTGETFWQLVYTEHTNKRIRNWSVFIANPSKHPWIRVSPDLMEWLRTSKLNILILYFIGYTGVCFRGFRI